MREWGKVNENVAARGKHARMTVKGTNMVRTLQKRCLETSKRNVMSVRSRGTGTWWGGSGMVERLINWRGVGNGEKKRHNMEEGQ
jgi:hypothetical protein